MAISLDDIELQKGQKVTEGFLRKKHGRFAEALAIDAKAQVRVEVALGRWDPSISAEAWVWPIILRTAANSDSQFGRKKAYDTVIQDATEDVDYQEHLTRYVRTFSFLHVAVI